MRQGEMLTGFKFGKKKEAAAGLAAPAPAPATDTLTDEAIPAISTAEDAVKPNELEELFRASLSAKNEELHKNAALLDSLRRELGKEVGHVALLNSQLAAAEDALHAKDVHIMQANRRILELEQANADLKNRNEHLLLGGESSEGELKAVGENRRHGRSSEVGWGAEDAVIEDLTAREAAANRRVLELEASVAALRQVTYQIISSPP